MLTAYVNRLANRGMGHSSSLFRHGFSPLNRPFREIRKN